MVQNYFCVCFERLKRGETVLIELNITPLGCGTHLSKEFAEIFKVIDETAILYTHNPGSIN